LAQVLRKGTDDRTDEAIVYLKKAVSIDGSDISSKHDLALCYLTKGQFDDAVELLKQVVDKEPDLTAAHVALAQAFYKLHRKLDGDRERMIVQRLQAGEQAKQNELRNSGPRPNP